MQFFTVKNADGISCAHEKPYEFPRINSTHWSWIFHVNIWAVYNMKYIHEEQMKAHLAKIGIYCVCYVLILLCLESFFLRENMVNLVSLTW